MKEFEGLSEENLKNKLFDKLKQKFPEQYKKVFNSPKYEFACFADQYCGGASLFFSKPS